MHNLFIILFYFTMLIAPMLVAHSIMKREAAAAANQELFTLRRSGKSTGGTLYTLPGVEVVEISYESQPSAGRRAASGPASPARARAC